MGQLRRHVSGTGSRLVHDLGSLVVDSGVNQIIPGAIDSAGNNHLFLEVSATSPTPLVTGSGLDFSSTMAAQFLRNGPSYDPSALITGPNHVTVTGTAVNLTIL